MTIKTKLFTGFITAAAITLLVGASGYRGLRQAVATQQEIITGATTARRAVDLARGSQVAFKTQVQEWKNILLRGNDPAAFAKYLEGFDREEALVQTNLVQLQTLLAGAGLPATNAARTRQAHAELGVKYRAALKQFAGADGGGAARVDGLVKGVDRAPTEAIDAIVHAINRFAEENAATREQQARAGARVAQMVTVGGAVAGLVLSLGMGAWLSLAITRHIQEVAGRLNEGANQVSAAAGQVSAASQNLAGGASEQAASLEETSASLEELSSMTRRNAESAKSAKTLVGRTRQAAEASAGDVEKMSVAMTALRQSSEQVTKIIKTIDEIAFQTNILALNAAVEAARAGVAGAGFAVVAEEVRNLAQRSAGAARETAEKLEEAQQRSRQGVEISTQVARGLGEITGQVRELDELVAAIALASGEQSQGINQVNIAVAQMDKVTQANAATAEETASASEELNSQAAALKEELVRLAGVPQPTVADSPAEPAFTPPASPAPARKSAAWTAHPAPAFSRPKGGAAQTSGGDFQSFTLPAAAPGGGELPLPAFETAS